MSDLINDVTHQLSLSPRSCWFKFNAIIKIAHPDREGSKTELVEGGNIANCKN